MKLFWLMVQYHFMPRGDAFYALGNIIDECCKRRAAEYRKRERFPLRPRQVAIVPQNWMG